jgi:hypothetical protein
MLGCNWLLRICNTAQECYTGIVSRFLLISRLLVRVQQGAHYKLLAGKVVRLFFCARKASIGQLLPILLPSGKAPDAVAHSGFDVLMMH